MTGPARSPAELDAATEADRRAYLDAGLTELSCGTCGGRVWVKKYSLAHTSTQWSTDAMRRCPAFDPREGCAHLRGEVMKAVRDGRLAVGDE